jgi:DNA polymerase-3 subunit delta'
MSLSEIIGQARAVSTLQTVVASGRIHHAWIFSGPLGVGKHTAARALASELLSHGDPIAAEMLRRGVHPDLHLVSKELASISRVPGVQKQKQTSIAKEVLEEFLVEPASRSRAHFGPSPIGKVFVVDEAHMISAKNQNSLLKIIEEPPNSETGGTVIILCAIDEHRLLPTIRSRCQRLAFGALSDVAMQQWLQSRDLKLPDDQRTWLLNYAAGSPGMLLNAIEHNLLAWHSELSPMLDAIELQPLKAAKLGPAMAKLVDAHAAASIEGIKEASKETANRLWARRMIAFVADRLRRQLHLATRSRDFARAARIARALDACTEAELHLAANVLPAGLLENLAAQLATVLAQPPAARAGEAMLV